MTMNYFLTFCATPTTSQKIEFIFFFVKLPKYNFLLSKQNRFQRCCDCYRL